MAADLEQLAALRKYLIFDRKVAIPGRDSIHAIDDYAEKLTSGSPMTYAGYFGRGGGNLRALFLEKNDACKKHDSAAPDCSQRRAQPNRIEDLAPRVFKRLKHRLELLLNAFHRPFSVERGRPPPDDGKPRVFRR